MNGRKPYPIIEQRTLAEAPKRGRLGLGGRSREHGDLPRVDAHQVLVYRVGGRFVLDNGLRGLNDDEVVNATHVSLVDMTRNTLVTVDLTIPSAEASEFTVRVDFICTVIDPETIVKDGPDAALALLGYLRSHHRIFELGLDHPLSAINQVRQYVKAQIQAYTQLKPPNVPGMSIDFASVQVLTPDELVTLYRTLRGQEHGHTIAAGERQSNHVLELTRAAQDSELERARAQNEQALERLRIGHEQAAEQQRLHFERERQVMEHRLEQQRLMGEQQLAAQTRAFVQQETEEVHASIGDDPLKAALLAHIKGELTTTELAGRLDAAREAERADQEALRQERRADALRAEAADEEARRYAIGVRLDVLKEVVARHGHLDGIHLEVEGFTKQLMDDLTGNGRTAATAATAVVGGENVRPEGVQSAETVAELPQRSPAEPADDVADVREEDGD